MLEQNLSSINYLRPLLIKVANLALKSETVGKSVIWGADSG